MGHDRATPHSSRASSRASTRASTPLSFPSSISSLASKTARATKTALKSVKNAAKKIIRPLKKAPIAPRSSNASMVGSERSAASVGESGISSEKEKEGESDDEESDGAELSMCSVTDEHYFKLIRFAERLSKGWRSAVYGFFKPDVKIGYDGGRKYHFFHCAAQKCQGMKGVHGVRRFQDSKDRAATSNLKYHAIKCFGKDAVDAAFNDTQPKARDASIFAVFARQGQRPVKVSHRAHTKAESR
jgi:hypothetical protein